MTPEELRERRKRLGLTQPQLAELLGQKVRSAVSRWETAERLPATRSAWLDREVARIEREHKRPRGRPPRTLERRRRCDRCARFIGRDAEVCAACAERRPSPSAGRADREV